MKNPLFRISRLACSYSHKPEDKVLYIEELDLPKGEIIFLLGASGSGKSTLLETLGLMNDTFADGSVEFFPDQSGQAVRLEDLWYSEQAEQLSSLRRNHFSFIFQNTNLMESFTAYENICLAPMIQDNSNIGDSLQRAGLLMERVNIPLNQVGYDTLSVNLSGGQRQRVAFVRALMARHTVLFCDEPTGNLDEKNANELMSILREAITPESSVIIVSHDINLALAHGTMIVCMSKDEEAGCSIVRNRDVFRRRDWEGLSGTDFEQFRKKIRSYYENVEDIMRGSREEARLLPQVKADYATLFRSRESHILRGKRFVNLVVIATLLLVTFLSVGFANGSLEYLETKMKNPFVQWMTIKIPSSRAGLSGDVGDVINKLNSSEVRSAYYIQSVSGYSQMMIRVAHNVTGKYTPKRLRTINPDADRMMGDVFSASNLLRGDSTGFSSANDFGLVCTARFLSGLGFNEDATFVLMVNMVTDTTGNTEYLLVPVPVRAVVKELPGTFEGLVTPAFYAAYFTKIRGPFDIRQAPDVTYFVEGDEARAQEFAEKLKPVLARYSVNGGEIQVEEPTPHELSYGEGFDVKAVLLGLEVNPDDIQRLADDLAKEEGLIPTDGSVQRIFDFSASGAAVDDRLDSYDAISINLASLDRVRELGEYIFDEFNTEDDLSLIEMDITKVREKENYNFMSKITLVISWLVIIFGSLSIGLFIFNLLKMHLSKVSTTLGTFKAFGLPDRQATGIYFAIIFRFLLIAFVVAAAGAIGLGYALNALLHQIFILEFGIDYFLINHANTYLTIFIMIATAFGVSWFTIRQILNRTPGDLIYRR
ncbi:MAG: ATP-binding cassette domain-containing protein [Flavobacteriales bacterium]